MKRYSVLTSCLESFYVQETHLQTFLHYKIVTPSTAMASFPDSCVSISLFSLSAHRLSVTLHFSSPLMLRYSSCTEKNGIYTCTFICTFVVSPVSVMLSLSTCKLGLSFPAALTSSTVNLEAAIANPPSLCWCEERKG